MGQRLEEITLVDMSTPAHVPPSAPHRGGIDIGGVQLNAGKRGGERRTHRTGATAQVHDDGGLGGERDGLLDQELRSAAGHEDAGFHCYAQTSELGPAQDVFEGQARDPAVHHHGEFGGCACGGEDQSRLVLGEDTTCGAERGDDLCVRRWHGSREPFGKPKGALQVT